MDSWLRLVFASKNLVVRFIEVFNEVKRLSRGGAG